MSSGLHTLPVKLLSEVQSLNLSRVNLMHLLESVIGKTGLLGRGGLFWDWSGLVKVTEVFPEDPLLLRKFWFSLTLH